MLFSNNKISGFEFWSNGFGYFNHISPPTGGHLTLARLGVASFWKDHNPIISSIQ